MSNKPKFKFGDLAPGGSKIEYIYGQTDSVLVYRTGDDYSVNYYIDDAELSDKDQEVLTRYQYLRTRVFDILPKKQWKRFIDDLASVLFNALAVADLEKSKAAFHDIEGRILELTRGYSRFCYWLSSLVTAFLLGAIGFALYHWYPVEQHRIYALYIVFALGGSLASVMLRSSSVEVGPFELRGSLVVRGAFRIILGGLLAAFFIAASKANLLMGIVATTSWSLLAFSFLSGFSERFVPDILAELEKKKVSTQSKQRPGSTPTTGGNPLGS